MDQRNGTTRYRWRQWLATLAASLAMVHVGGGNFWLMKTINDSRRYKTMSAEDLRFIVREAAFFVELTGGVIGAILGALLADKFGRKKILLVTCIFAVCQILSTLTTNIMLSYMTLIVGAMGLGIIRVLVPLFVSEIVDDDIRGTLLTVQLPLFHCGQIFTIWIMSLDVIEIFGVFSAILTEAFLISFLWFPETPNYLIFKKKYEAASKSLAFYRGIETAAADQEINLIIKNIKSDNISQGFFGKIRELARPNNRKGLLIIVFLEIGKWSGVSFYLLYEFEYILADVQLWNNFDTQIITNLISLIASIIIVFTIDVIGRRSILAYSTYGCFIIVIISVIIRETYTTNQVWIIYGINIYSKFCLLIISSVSLVYIGELFSINVKAMAIAIVTVVDLLSTFTFFVACESVGSFVNSFIHATVLLLVLLITITFAPETRRKSFSDIQTELSKSFLPKLWRRKVESHGFEKPIERINSGIDIRANTLNK